MRMPPRSSLLFGTLAVVSALIAVWLMQAWAAGVERARPDGGSPRELVVAALDLSRGEVLTTEDIATRTLPANFAPPGAVADPAAIVGRTLAADVVAGEALTPARLVGTVAGPVAALVPVDRRAYLMPSGLPPGSVRPGDRVDVLATFGGGRSHVETVAEGLEVAYALKARGATTPTTSATGSSGGDTLVLLVDPDTAERLAYANAFAKLTVTVEPPSEAGPGSAAPPSTPSAAP
jgi:pilus assembly protein CpaB